MNKEEWKTEIYLATKAAGTYQPFFDASINTLAGILEMRDDAQEKFEKSGGETVVENTNVKGGTYMSKNPALVTIMDLNAQALTFWRDLGLTPAGLKKINEQALKGRKKSALADALKELGG